MQAILKQANMTLLYVMFSGLMSDLIRVDGFSKLNITRQDVTEQVTFSLLADFLAAASPCDVDRHSCCLRRASPMCPNHLKFNRESWCWRYFFWRLAR